MAGGGDGGLGRRDFMISGVEVGVIDLGLRSGVIRYFSCGSSEDLVRFFR